ncbi:MAG: hypothetical protein JWR21_913 [Herminiimonas sp.]|nr:hypothetical protein [Herminiimonas sp.]
MNYLLLGVGLLVASFALACAFGLFARAGRGDGLKWTPTPIEQKVVVKITADTSELRSSILQSIVKITPQSDWFPRNVKPIHNGTYQCRDMAGEDIYSLVWRDGTWFYPGVVEGLLFRSFDQEPEWRGLSKPVVERLAA